MAAATILASLLSLCSQLELTDMKFETKCNTFMIQCVRSEYNQQHGDVSDICFKKFLESAKQ